jgi:hypothetical protein
MEGSVLSFLKAEWKVSDTGSATEPLVFFAYQFWNLATFSGPPSKLVPHFKLISGPLLLIC